MRIAKCLNKNFLTIIQSKESTFINKTFNILVNIKLKFKSKNYKKILQKERKQKIDLFFLQKMIAQADNIKKMEINDLMYNIQTKISLLSEIEENCGLKNKHETFGKNLESNRSEQFSQINLPMQILNKKMMEIFNNQPEDSVEEKKHNQQTQERKKISIYDLQTGTRNIQEMKKRSEQNQEKSGNKIKNLNQKEVNQFHENNSEVYMSQSVMNSSSKSSSKIIDKFNSIEINYMDKIKALTFKVSFLEQHLQQTQQEKRDIMGSLETYKLLYSRKQQEIDKQVQRKLQQMKQKLIDRFAEQCRMKYNEYISELKQVTGLLNEERKKRKFYQDQNRVLKLQKQNYEQMYKSLLKKQKQYLKIDIDKTRNQLNSQIQISTQNYLQQGMYIKPDNGPQQQYSQIENKNYPDSIIFQKESLVNDEKNKKKNIIAQSKQQKTQGNRKSSTSKQKNQSIPQKRQSFSKQRQEKQHFKKKLSTQKEKSRSKSKQPQNKSKKKSQSNLSNNHHFSLGEQQMSKQELIPFLAKGIQQLKQRLKMNN